MAGDGFNLSKFDYQLDRHCSKTAVDGIWGPKTFDYQLDRHCSKTETLINMLGRRFDYQLDRHCSKTPCLWVRDVPGLITS